MKASELLRQLATTNVFTSNQVETKEGNPLLADLFPTVTHMLRYSWKKVIATITFAAILTSFPGVAGAWTWVLHHQGWAPNTNWNWTSIHQGGPRVGVWNYDKNDPDQQISFVENNGGHMLVNITTGLCYNVAIQQPLKEVNTYECDRNDPEQQFKVHNAGNVAPDVMNVMIQLKDTNFCFANSERYQYGKLVVDYCRWGQNHPDQMFYMEKVSDYIHSISTNTYSTSPAPGLTLIRTGGSGDIIQAAINGAARGVVNGLVQTNEGLVPILHVIAQYQEHYVNAERAKQSPDYREVQVDSPIFGKKIIYTADWGYYVRLEGEQIQSMANKLKREAPKAAWVYGTTVTTLLGLTRNKYAIALIPTAAPAAGIQGADNIQALVDEIEACGRTTKVAFVRLKLLSGSWENSKRLNLVSPFYAGALDTEISCY